MNPVDTFERYAAACRAVGCGGLSADRIRELGAGEDGLGMAALQADAAALRVAAGHAQAALCAQRSAAGLLAAAWQGRSASAASDLLERHCATAAGTVAALTEAADVLERLCGRLTRLLAERDEAGVRIAGRRSAEQPWWLACSDAVLAGTADGAAVAEVATRIAPFVNTDVARDWVASVTAVTDGVRAAYREAAAVMAARPMVAFDVPSAVVGLPGRTARSSAAFAAAPGLAAPPPNPAPPVGSAAATDPVLQGLTAPTSAPAVAGVPGWAPGSLSSGIPSAGLADARIGSGRKRRQVDLSSDMPADDEPDDAPDDEGGDEPEGARRPVEPESEPDLDTRAATGGHPAQIRAGIPQGAPESAPSVGSEQGADGPAASVFGAPPEPEPEPEPAPTAEGLPPAPLAAEAGSGERAPCEIAVDALPQIGQ